MANTAGSIVSEGVRFIVNSAPDPSPPPPSPPPGQSTNPNLDDASSWAQGHINDAVEKGFLTDELTVGFQTAITRGEFVRLAMSWLRYVTLMTDGQLVAAYGDPAHAGRTFADTSDPAILAAARLDITAGVGNGLFGVNDLFNREQAAVMLTKVFAILGADVSNAPGAGFTDINSASSWARNAINYVGTYGAMSGIGGGLFGPLLPFTREQSITVFNQMG
ncbi:MAG: S-layer homology domain-containing protein [Oscillospiraceae bacterium]|nr:S-layer homology domain-containing protein [Oscillospiraceae bacterium]